MKKNIYFLLPLLCMAIAGYGQGYIYIHKNTTDENSSPTFTFNVTGPNSFNKSYSLNDQHPVNNVRDIGATGNGGLYAVAGNSISGNGYGVYYRAADATTWTKISNFEAIRIDGGPNDTHIHVNKNGETYYYSGSASTPLGTTNAVDVAFDKSGTNRVFYTSTSNGLFYRNATSGSWTQTPNIAARNIDVAPNGKVVSTGSSNYTNVYISDYNGTSIVNLGSPSGGTVADVAVGDDGIIYALAGDFSVYRYTGGYASGGSWVVENTSRLSMNITGGNGGQLWAATGAGNNPTPNSIWARTPGGFWIDDESVRSNDNGNSVLIPVAPGTYSVTEATTANWSLGSVDIYDPTNNSTSNVATRTTSVNVVAGEVVHLTYRNFLVTSFPVVNNCSGSAYLETFGTGTSTTLGGPLAGQTNYHYIGDNGIFMNDGYYMVASNSAQAAAGDAVFGSYKDHTTGDGTGRMMLVNASYDKGEFFRRRFTGLLTNTAYSFSAWIMSLNQLSIKPNVKFEIIDPATQTVLATLSTGDVTTSGQWKQYQLQFTASQGEVDLVLRNNNIGGYGNDLALDDIRFGLAQPNQPLVSLTNPGCSTPGSLTVTEPTGAALEYSLNGTSYQSSPVFSSVAPGSYSVTARYTNSVGCVSAPAAVTATTSICGNIFNDGNGLTDNTVNTSGANAQSPLNGTSLDGTPLYVTLVNAGGTAVTTVPVNADGTYAFTSVANGTYSVVLSTNSSGSTTASLPTSWTNVGEKLGTGTGSDGNANGILTNITVNGSSVVTNANFGIDKKPMGITSTDSSRPNLGSNVSSPVSSSVFGGSDAEDGTYSANLSGRSVTLYPATGGTLYYNGTPVSASTVIPNFDPTKVSVAPSVNGVTSVSFTYSIQDNAGVSSTPTGITVPFSASPATISGSVWNDADGSLSQNGAETGTNAGGPLYVNLVNTAGTVVTSTMVASDGTYSLSDVPANTTGLKLVLTNSATSNTPGSLPTGWVNTGEPAGVGNGATQSNTPGQIELTTGTSAITAQNFGIEQLPTPGSGTATVANSGGTSTVPVPPSAFTSTSPSTDTAPGSVTAIRITNFPSNVSSLIIDGTTYTINTFPASGVIVPTNGSGAPTVAILIDPTNDNNPSSFTFTAIDNASKESATTGTATVNSVRVPDLTPIIYALPTVVNGTKPITVVVDVVELMGTATSGTIRVYVSKDNRTSLNFSSSDAIVGGRSVNNSVWSFDGSSNAGYYILTTNQAITAGDKLSFGLNGSLTPGATQGTLTISAVILGGSGGEVKITNNVDADKIDYFIK